MNKYYKYQVISAIFIVFSLGIAPAQTTDTLKSNSVAHSDTATEMIKSTICNDSLISYSKSLLGSKYLYANCDPKSGFDCSGFVYYVFNHFGVKVPRSSKDYDYIKTTIPIDSAKVGDIIVFTGTNAKIRKPGHVGIVISNPGEELTFIQSSSNKKRGGVIISTFISSPYYEKRFLKVVRLDENPVGPCSN